MSRELPCAGRARGGRRGRVRTCNGGGRPSRRRYFAIQVAMRADVLSRWSAQNATSIRK